MDGSGGAESAKVKDIIERMESVEREGHGEKSPIKEYDSSREDFSFRRSGLMPRTPPLMRTSFCSGRIERIEEKGTVKDKEKEVYEQTKKRPRKEDSEEVDPNEVGHTRKDEQGPKEIEKEEGVNPGQIFSEKIREFTDTILTMTARESGNKLAFGRTEQQRVRESTQNIYKETIAITYKMGQLEQEVRELKEKEERNKKEMTEMKGTLKLILERLGRIENNTNQTNSTLGTFMQSSERQKEKTQRKVTQPQKRIERDEDSGDRQDIDKPGPSTEPKEKRDIEKSSYMQKQNKKTIETGRKTYAEVTEEKAITTFRSDYETPT